METEDQKKQTQTNKKRNTKRNKKKQPPSPFVLILAPRCTSSPLRYSGTVIKQRNKTMTKNGSSFNMLCKNKNHYVRPTGDRNNCMGVGWNPNWKILKSSVEQGITATTSFFIFFVLGFGKLHFFSPCFVCIFEFWIRFFLCFLVLLFFRPRHAEPSHHSEKILRRHHEAFGGGGGFFVDAPQAERVGTQQPTLTTVLAVGAGLVVSAVSAKLPIPIFTRISPSNIQHTKTMSFEGERKRVTRGHRRRAREGGARGG